MVKSHGWHRSNNSFKPSPLRGLVQVPCKFHLPKAAKRPGLTQALERMEVFSILLIAFGTLTVPAECNLPCTMDKALSGDGLSALKMAQESTKSQSSEIVENWYRIAAENGNAQGQLAYAKVLISASRHRQDCIRAKFWLERASIGGESVATTLAQRLAASLSAPGAFDNGCKGAL